MLYNTRVAQRNNLTPDRIRARVLQYWMISYAPCFMRMENESSLSLTNFPRFWTVICENQHLKVLVWNWSCCSSEYSRIPFQTGLPCSMTSSKKWWQIKIFLVFMIFTPQCLVSRYNLEKIERINITKKPVILPAFWNNMYNLVKNTKYSSRKQNRNRLRVDVLLTLCSLWRNRGKHRDSREIKT